MEAFKAKSVKVINKYSVPLPVIFCNGGKFVQAWCPVVDVATQGNSHEEAKKNMEEVLDMYFEDEDTIKPSLKSMMSISVSLQSVPVKIKDGAHAKIAGHACA